MPAAATAYLLLLLLLLQLITHLLSFSQVVSQRC
jgi:hypothetical protein